MAHSLPCLLDFDGPTLYNYAWSGYLLPLDKYITSEMQVFFGQAPLYWGDVMAFASMITIPVLIVFLLFQRWFLRSVASTGIQG